MMNSGAGGREPQERGNLADMPSEFDGDYPSFNSIHDTTTREVQS
jgi:hypothetical protein